MTRPPTETSGCGLFVDWHGYNVQHLFALYPAGKQHGFYSDPQRIEGRWFRLPNAKQSGTVTMRCWDQQLKVLLDGNEVTIDSSSFSPLDNTRSYVGVVGCGGEKDTFEFEVTDIRIRKLTAALDP